MQPSIPSVNNIPNGKESLIWCMWWRGSMYKSLHAYWLIPFQHFSQLFMPLLFQMRKSFFAFIIFSTYLSPVLYVIEERAIFLPGKWVSRFVPFLQTTATHLNIRLLGSSSFLRKRGKEHGGRYIVSYLVRIYIQVLPELK